MKLFLKYFLVVVILLTFNNLYSQNIQCDSLLVLNEPIMPNIFTPNVDGYNDGFNIKADCIKSIDKKIYNRWGELIFYSTQINELWDGRTNTGTEAPSGTYYYIFIVNYSSNLNTETKTYKGSLTLVR